MTPQAKCVRPSAVALVLLMLASTAAAQGSKDAASEVGVAAVRLVQERAPSAALLLVHADGADSDFVTRIGRTLHLRARGVAESKTCVGTIPQCPWQTGRDTISVRVTMPAISPAGATLIVETWGRAPESQVHKGARAFYSKRQLEFVREGGRWKLVKDTPLLFT
jgi:hypothetical protein